jgi:hypothetical protein
MAERQFITNERGERTGVVLDIATYEGLTRTPHDPALLTGLSKNELQALANVKLAPDDQEQLSSLLAKQSEGKLSQEELTHLDNLIAQVDQLTLVKAKAMYTLHQLAVK